MNWLLSLFGYRLVKIGGAQIVSFTCRLDGSSLTASEIAQMIRKNGEEVREDIIKGIRRGKYCI